MTRYLINRLLRGIVSIIIVVGVVMVLVYSLVDRSNIFMLDSAYIKQQGNEREVYKYQSWELYGYLDFVPFADYMNELVDNGEITTEEKKAGAALAYTAEEDTPEVAAFVRQFTEKYESQGYTVVRLDAVKAGKRLKQGYTQQLFAYKDIPLYVRLFKYFTHLITVDNIHYVKEDIGKRSISFTLFDPVYNTEANTGEQTKKVFSPAIIGNGTQYKYLLYFDNQFPFIHQKLFHINMGLSYSVNTGVDVFDTMTQSQGTIVKQELVYPSGLTTDGIPVAYNLHSAQYSAGTFKGGNGDQYYTARFVDDYTLLQQNKASLSKTGFSFIIGLLSVLMAYFIGIPVGVAMARNKDKLVDKLGTFYIVFIIAVPSLAYIFMFRALGKAIGLPTTFDIDTSNRLMYVLPIVSLALPSIGGLMRWVRRYMIDQMNSDYVKFARSGGLSEKEIFNKHILKNAIIPIVHGVPGAVLGSLVGAIITERVYSVPGAGGMLVVAINYFDNGAIVGVTLFYATLSVLSLILGDIMMALIDPRISFVSKAR